MADVYILSYIGALKKRDETLIFSKPDGTVQVLFRLMAILMRGLHIQLGKMSFYGKSSIVFLITLINH